MIFSHLGSKCNYPTKCIFHCIDEPLAALHWFNFDELIEYHTVGLKNVFGKERNLSVGEILLLLLCCALLRVLHSGICSSISAQCVRPLLQSAEDPSHSWETPASCAEVHLLPTATEAWGECWKMMDRGARISFSSFPTPDPVRIPSWLFVDPALLFHKTQSKKLQRRWRLTIR